LDCFFEKLGEITFDNMPSAFDGFLAGAKEFALDGTDLLFGLEDISSYGRTLNVFLKANHQQVKHVNALLVARERKNRNIVEKSDSVDAECAARVLLSKFGELPDAVPDDRYWILRSLVARRSILVRHKSALKQYLHSLLTPHYPNYRRFFAHIEGDTSLAFFMKYPSPTTLKGTTVDELTAFLLEHSRSHIGMDRAREILDTLQSTATEYQEVRDMIVQSTIRQIQYNDRRNRTG
jgi:transposase